MTRPILVGLTSAGVATTAVVMSWAAAAILLATILITAVALCWILADHNRPLRLALLLTAWRHGIPPTPNQPTELPTTPRIFLNYRVGDSEQAASTFHSELGRALGCDNVFFASACTPPGTNFRQVIKARLQQTDTMLVLVGPHWMELQDNSGTRLLDRDNDLVRWEIEQALTLNLRVIPVLLDNATLDATRIPLPITDLTNRHWLHYRYNYREHDLRIIIESLLLTDRC